MAFNATCGICKTRHSSLEEYRQCAADNAAQIRWSEPKAEPRKPSLNESTPTQTTQRVPSDDHLSLPTTEPPSPPIPVDHKDGVKARAEIAQGMAEAAVARLRTPAGRAETRANAQPGARAGRRAGG